MNEPFEYKLSKEEELEFEKELENLKIEKSKKHIPFLNYNISKLSDEELFADLHLVKTQTFYLDLIKKLSVDNETKLQLALNFQDEIFTSYPIEFRKMIIRKELNISIDKNEINNKKKEFDEIIKKEKEEEEIYNNALKKKQKQMTLERKKVSVYF